MTFQEFTNKYFNNYVHKCFDREGPKLREGQYMANLLAEVNPKLYEKIITTKYDPFYETDHEKLADIFEHLNKIWE